MSSEIVSNVGEAEHKKKKDERMSVLKSADGKLRTALNAVYADIDTTTRSFARKRYSPFYSLGIN